MLILFSIEQYIDILSAIDWIRNEIVNFGGDANRLTLMGHSSSAEMISLLSMSPTIMKHNYFQQAIGMSCARYDLKHHRNMNVSLALVELAQCTSSRYELSRICLFCS